MSGNVSQVRQRGVWGLAMCHRQGREGLGSGNVSQARQRVFGVWLHLSLVPEMMGSVHVVGSKGVEEFLADAYLMGG